VTITSCYHNVRPAGELLPQESAAFDLLESLHIDYDRVSSDPADTMEKCAAVSAALGVPICKNLFLCNRQQTEFYLLCMQPDKPFKTKDLSHQIGSARLSFASEAQLWELLRCTPGSATILGLMNDTEHRVHLLIDRPVIESAWFSCHPCLCTSSLKLKTADVLDVFLPYTGHTPTIVDLPEPEDAE
jgi:Ala-tRNA(Pro) deacylase